MFFFGVWGLRFSAGSGVCDVHRVQCFFLGVFGLGGLASRVCRFTRRFRVWVLPDGKQGQLLNPKP